MDTQRHRQSHSFLLAKLSDRNSPMSVHRLLPCDRFSPFSGPLTTSAKLCLFRAELALPQTGHSHLTWPLCSHWMEGPEDQIPWGSSGEGRHPRRNVDCEVALNQNNDDRGIDSEEAFKRLSTLKVNDPVMLVKVELVKHHTKPPARYSEGSLVKKLEELGIGRPSTYAPIIKVLQDRNYVIMKNRILLPEFRGRMV
ncbi:hypothetical protein Taro_004202 [Colocasia esculenta]|uniref:Topo IA-type catalytic domain-containing protein n=1 Tax=Colocasia esculenta TaxID=4460 RepID=A0A843TJE1_COLES|nr:hypothetical protein [Colocasia esculenta]